MRKFIQYRVTDGGLFSITSGEKEPTDLPEGVMQVEVFEDTHNKLVDVKTGKLYDKPPPEETFAEKWSLEKMAEALSNEELLREMQKDLEDEIVKKNYGQ